MEFIKYKRYQTEPSGRAERENVIDKRFAGVISLLTPHSPLPIKTSIQNERSAEPLRLNLITKYISKRLEEVYRLYKLDKLDKLLRQAKRQSRSLKNLTNLTNLINLKNLTKLTNLALLALLLCACQETAREQQQTISQALQQQRDSLDNIIAMKEAEIDDMISTLNDIQEGFREIDQAEQRVSLAKAGEGANASQRIRENIQFIQQAMKQNRELIAKLRQQVRESTTKSQQLRKTIDALVRQMEDKDNQLKHLRAELDKKDIHIMELDETIADLNTSVGQLTDESNQKTETISAQDKQLNTAWFVFGTKRELKEQGIIDGSRVLEGSYNGDYFTKIDIRVDKEIKLYSRSAKLLTAHPAASYTLAPDINGQYVLKITDPQRFWSTSKYLVILVK